jgi:hypothetical protein
MFSVSYSSIEQRMFGPFVLGRKRRSHIECGVLSCWYLYRTASPVAISVRGLFTTSVTFYAKVLTLGTTLTDPSSFEISLLYLGCWSEFLASMVVRSVTRAIRGLTVSLELGMSCDASFILSSRNIPGVVAQRKS